MKRHVQLQPLSRQHHNALLAVLLLKKGIKKAAIPQDMAAFIINFSNTDLEAHFKAEEYYLLPLLSNIDFDEALIDTIQQEHAILRSYIYLLHNDPTNMKIIQAFTEVLEKHIRFEEKQFFPAAEILLTEAQLQELGKHLHEGDNKNCMNYPVQFWK